LLLDTDPIDEEGSGDCAGFSSTLGRVDLVEFLKNAEVRENFDVDEDGKFDLYENML
jgi:hypothetical protein